MNIYMKDDEDIVTLRDEAICTFFVDLVRRTSNMHTDVFADGTRYWVSIFGYFSLLDLNRRVSEALSSQYSNYRGRLSIEEADNE